MASPKHAILRSGNFSCKTCNVTNDVKARTTFHVSIVDFVPKIIRYHASIIIICSPLTVAVRHSSFKNKKVPMTSPDHKCAPNSLLLYQESYAALPTELCIYISFKVTFLLLCTIEFRCFFIE